MPGYDLIHWMAFAGTAAAVILSPGPDMAAIVMRSLTSGKRGGLASLAGMCAGALLQVLAVTFGLGALIAASPVALQVIKLGGAAYLLMLGVRLLSARAMDESTRHDGTEATTAAIFRSGFLINLLNPKAIVFYLAFLPQFVEPDHGPQALQLLLHGVMVIMLAIVIYLPVIAVISHGKRAVGKPRSGRAMERITGAAFVALGVRLAWVA